MKYAEELKRHRIENKLTQQQLSRATGISQQAISDYENGKNQPTIGICEKLADFYGISIDELVDHEVKKNW